jgi:hypothetical protein
MLSKVFNGFDRLCRPPPPGGGEARGVEMLETQGNSKVILGRQPCCPITHFSWYVTQSRRKKPNDTSRNGSVSLPLQSSQVPPLHKATAARPGRRARMSSRHGNTSGESPTRPPRLRAQARWRGAPIVRFFGLALGQTTVAGGWANPNGAAAVLPTMCLGRPVIEARQHLWRGHLSTGPAGKSAEVQRCAQTDQIQRWGLGEPPARPKGGLALAKAVWTHCLKISRF